MKGKTTNTYKYTGTVTLSQYIGDKKLQIAKIHNAGENPLFDFLADCLTGDFELAVKNRPNKIRLLYSENQDCTITSYRSDFILINSPPTKLLNSSDTPFGGVTYSFVIPYDQIWQGGFNLIGLYCATAQGDSAMPAALCQVGELNLTQSSVVLLDWELKISNGG
jgi:hypothetical protein